MYYVIFNAKHFAMHSILDTIKYIKLCISLYLYIYIIHCVQIIIVIHLFILFPHKLLPRSGLFNLVVAIFVNCYIDTFFFSSNKKIFEENIVQKIL